MGEPAQIVTTVLAVVTVFACVGAGYLLGSIERRRK